jgi:predicted ATPase/DNA-binding SARP family transcriptional activator
MSGEEVLHIQLLGPPKVFWKQKPLLLKRRTTRLLLYFLAYQTDSKLVGRNQVMAHFWPNHTEEIARRNLRDWLSKLRKELPGDNFIQTDREWIWLNEKMVQVDAYEFEEIYQQINLPILMPADRPLPETVYQKLLYALNMWQASQFMYGEKAFDQDELQEWLDKNNFQLRKKRLDLLTRLGRHYMFLGDYEEAIKWFDTVIDEDEYMQFINANLFRLEAFFRLGRITEAWEICTDLKIEYTAQDFESYGQLFNDLCREIEVVRSGSAVNISNRDLTIERGEWPFVGRADLLQKLTVLYQNGGVVFVQGEAGIGKSRLVKQAFDQLFPSPLILSFSAFAAESDIPFHPVLEFMRQQIKFDDWEKLDQFWLRHLVHLFPELNKRLETELSIGVFDQNSDNQRAVLEAFYQLFQTIVQEKRFVMVLENAQWCDEKTIQLLSFLIERNFFKEKGLLVMVSRSDVNQNQLKQIKNNERWLNQVHVLDVPGFDMNEIAQIGQAILRAPLPQIAVKQLKLETNGNPLYIIETMRVVLALTIDLDHKESWSQIPLPANIQILIRDQVNQLSGFAKQVILEAAVLGLEFDLGLLRIASTLPEDGLVAGLEELIRKGFLKITTQLHQVNRYRFLKKRVRDVVLMDIGETKRQLIHVRIGKALENHREAKKSLELTKIKATHLTEAGETQAAFSAWIELANLALNLNAWAKANEAFGMAKHVAEIFSIPLTQQQYYALYIGWSDAALRYYDISTANIYYQKAAMEGQRRGFYELWGGGLRGQAHLYILRGLPAQATGLIENALSVLQHRANHELIKTRTIKGFLFIKQVQLRAALTEFEKAVSIKIDETNPLERTSLIEAMCYAARTYAMIGELDKAEKFALEALNKSRDDGKHDLLALAENSSGFVCFIKGDYQKSIFHYGSCVELAKLVNDWRLIIESWVMLSRIYIRKGVLFQAQGYLEKIEQLLKINQTLQLDCMFKLSQAILAIYLHEYKAALNLLEEADASRPNEFQKIMIQYYLSLAEFGNEQAEAAIYRMREVISRASMGDYKQIEYLGKSQLLLMMYRNGRSYQDLQEELESLMMDGDRFGFAEAGGVVLYIQSQQAINQKDWAAAEEKIKQIEKIAAPEEVLWLYYFAERLRESLYIESEEKHLNSQSQKEIYLNKIFTGFPDVIKQKASRHGSPWVALN